MAHNRYYIINADDPNMNDINDIIVGRPDTQRYSIDNSQIVIKLHEEDHHQHDCLQQYTEESHDEILQSLSSPEWTPEIPINE